MKLLKKILLMPSVWLLLFSVLYFAIRLTNLTSLPIFTDEAIYLRWSQIGVRDAAWRFISLTDGKQPLFTWFVMATMKIIDDPLVAGRLVSVASGFVSLIGMYFLGSEVFKRKRIGVIASFLYLISPFTLMYDRMAIYDSMVAAISIWNLYIAILFVRYIRLDIALIFGMTLGVGMLNKTSGFLSLYLLPGTLLLFDWSKKLVLKRIMYWVLLALISAVLSQIIYSVLRLSPYFYIVAQKNTIFVYPFKEWLEHPFTFLQGNLHGMFDWLITYMSIPLFAASFASLVVHRKQISEKILLLAWWFIPFLGLALFGKVLYPRFILFMAMPLYVLAAYSIDRLLIMVKNRAVSWIVILLCVFQSVNVSFQIIRDIKTAQLPKSEIGQYINDWPSGWGIDEIVNILEIESKKSPIAVYTEGTFGLLPYALEVYLHANTNIEIHGVWPPEKTMQDYIGEKAKTTTTFYITNLTQTVPLWPITLVDEFQKGTNTQSHIRLYKVEPSKSE